MTLNDNEHLPLSKPTISGPSVTLEIPMVTYIHIWKLLFYRTSQIGKMVEPNQAWKPVLTWKTVDLPRTVCQAMKPTSITIGSTCHQYIHGYICKINNIHVY
jgi:hypothetical protein